MTVTLEKTGMKTQHGEKSVQQRTKTRKRSLHVPTGSATHENTTTARAAGARVLSLLLTQSLESSMPFRSSINLDL